MNLCRGRECGQENGELSSGEVKNSKIENLIEDIQNLRRQKSTNFRWMTKPPDPTFSTLMDEIHCWYLWFIFIIIIIIVLVWLLLLLLLHVQFLFIYIYIIK